MGEGFQFLDIIIIAAIAAFLVFRLRGVLGKRTGHQQRPGYDPFRKEQKEEGAQEKQEKVVQLPDRSGKPQDGAEGAATALDGGGGELSGLTQIKLADPGFDTETFIQGAKVAFEMVIASFARGDTRSLRPLLSNDVYDDFAGAIKAREQAKQSLDTTLVGFTEAEIIEAELQGRTAFVTVKFVTEQVNVTRDDQGKAIEGDESHVSTITDIWTFARNTRSRDPNWTLVATRSPN
ncbi:MAG: Tim44/TimA family putative adaptor protein [Kiloniellales bacterium]